MYVHIFFSKYSHLLCLVSSSITVQSSYYISTFDFCHDTYFCTFFLYKTEGWVQTDIIPVFPFITAKGLTIFLQFCNVDNICLACCYGGQDDWCYGSFPAVLFLLCSALSSHVPLNIRIYRISQSLPGLYFILTATWSNKSPQRDFHSFFLSVELFCLNTPKLYSVLHFFLLFF